MVVGVVPGVRVVLRAPANDNAFGAAMVQLWGVHGEAAVVVVALIRKHAFVVAEVSAVLTRVFVGSTGEDVVDDGIRFNRQSIHRASLKSRHSHRVSIPVSHQRRLLRTRTRASLAIRREIHPGPATHRNQRESGDDRQDRVLLRCSHGRNLPKEIPQPPI